MVTNSKEYSSKFYLDHKDQITRKIHCDVCNKSVGAPKYQRHARTKRHLAILNSMTFTKQNQQHGANNENKNSIFESSTQTDDIDYTPAEQHNNNTHEKGNE
jgi:hypothetical protein